MIAVLLLTITVASAYVCAWSAAEHGST